MKQDEKRLIFDVLTMSFRTENELRAFCGHIRIAPHSE